MALNSKRKGSAAERELAAILRERGWLKARRTPFSGAGYEKGDVAGFFVPEGLDFHTEVKRTERLALPAAIRQAKADAPSGAIPIVVWRQSRTPWQVDIALEDFIAILRGFGAPDEDIRSLWED